MNEKFKKLLVLLIIGLFVTVLGISQTTNYHADDNSELATEYQDELAYNTQTVYRWRGLCACAGGGRVISNYLTSGSTYPTQGAAMYACQNSGPVCQQHCRNKGLQMRSWSNCLALPY